MTMMIDDLVFNFESDMIQGTSEDKRVLCIVHLGDESSILVKEQETLDAMSVLCFCASSGVGDAVASLKIDQFEPSAVRYVFDKAAEYKKMTVDFEMSSLCEDVKDMDLKKLCDVLEVSNFLDSPAISHAFSMVIAGKIKETSIDEITAAFRLVEDLDEEEMEKNRLARGPVPTVVWPL